MEVGYNIKSSTSSIRLWFDFLPLQLQCLASPSTSSLSFLTPVLLASLQSPDWAKLLPASGRLFMFMFFYARGTSVGSHSSLSCSRFFQELLACPSQPSLHSLRWWIHKHASTICTADYANLSCGLGIPQMSSVTTWSKSLLANGSPIFSGQNCFVFIW